MIDPHSAPDVWNKLIIAGMVSPGVVRLSGHDLKVGWDIANAQGQTGATSRRTGEPIKEFDAEFDLSNDPTAALNDDDFDAWDDFQALLESSTAGTEPKALEVYHPDLARNHITAVVLGSISGLALDGKGGGKIKVHFVEYRPPAKKTAGSAASTKTKKTEGDSQIDAAKKEIDTLQEEWKSL